MLVEEIKICFCLHAPGKSALHWAAAVNNVDAAVVLLKNGANKDMQNNKVQQIWDKYSIVELTVSHIYSCIGAANPLLNTIATAKVLECSTSNRLE